MQRLGINPHTRTHCFLLCYSVNGTTHTEEGSSTQQHATVTAKLRELSHALSTAWRYTPQKKKKKKWVLCSVQMSSKCTTAATTESSNILTMFCPFVKSAFFTVTDKQPAANRKFIYKAIKHTWLTLFRVGVGLLHAVKRWKTNVTSIILASSSPTGRRVLWCGLITN